VFEVMKIILCDIPKKSGKERVEQRSMKFLGDAPAGGLNLLMNAESAQC
jgi:hypothetical protein